MPVLPFILLGAGLTIVAAVLTGSLVFGLEPQRVDRMGSQPGIMARPLVAPQSP